MPYYSRQAPRAYADNSGSEIAAMIGSAASTVAHGVEDYDTKQRKAQAEAEYQKKLDKARDIEAMLKREELRIQRSKVYADQDKDAYEMEQDQAKLEAEAKRKRQEGYAFAMFANHQDYGYGESAPAMERTPLAQPPKFVPGMDTNSLMPWNQSQNQPKDTYAPGEVQYGNKPALPEDSFERSLAVGSEAGLDIEQQQAFNRATQKPRDFAAELADKQGFAAEQNRLNRVAAERRARIMASRPSATPKPVEIPAPMTDSEAFLLLKDAEAYKEKEKEGLGNGYMKTPTTESSKAYGELATKAENLARAYYRKKGRQAPSMEQDTQTPSSLGFLLEIPPQ